MNSPLEWYWSLNGDPGHVFSSASATTVSTSDGTYEAWLAGGKRPSVIGGTAGLTTAEAYSELYDVLLAQAPTVATAVFAAWSAAGYLTIAQQAAGAMTAGLTINSTSEPAINGTYAIDPATQGKIAAVEVYIMKAGTFPGAVSTYPWSDTSGTIHTFPNHGNLSGVGNGYRRSRLGD